jgi:DNA polymerase I
MQINYKYLQSNNEINTALDDLLNSPLITLDTETTGLDPHQDRVLLLQMGTIQNNYVISLLAENDLTQKVQDSPIWRKTVDILTNDSTKIGHNITFDAKMLKSHFGVEITKVYDTMLAERILTAGKSIKKMARLDELVPLYTDLTTQAMKKKVREGFYSGYVLSEFSEEQIVYSARDIAVLLPIYWGQNAKLVEEGLIATAELEFQVIPVTASMEYQGVDFDLNKWNHAIADLNTERLLNRRIVEKMLKENNLEKQRAVFDDFCTISVDSNKQVLQFLKQLGLPLEDSAASPVLERMVHMHPIIEPLLKYREQQKLVTAFGDNLLTKINPFTNRLHGSFLQIGADTGRFSAREPNLQQIPSDQKCSLRDCFIPPPGYVALGADYSQQELRVIAVASGEPNMLMAYAQGEDLHTVTTAFLFKKEISDLKQLLSSRENKIAAGDLDKITADEKEVVRMRKISKSINFLICYGGTYKKLANTARVSEDFAQEVMYNHGKAFPKLKEFIYREGNNTLSNMFSRTLLGRKRYYTLPDRNDPDYGRFEASIKRQGVNHIIQGTSADITKQALVNVLNEFNKKFGNKNAYLWAVVHDELQCMVREDLVNEASLVLSKCMEDAFYRFIPEDQCPMKVDTQSGPHWVH